MLVGYLSFTLLTYKDYGITVDEKTVYDAATSLGNHLTTRMNYRNTIIATYMLEPNLQRHAPLLSDHYRFYATVLSFFNKYQSYERYHFYNLVFASLMIVVPYLMLYFLYKRPLLATLGPLFIMLTPRFLGHIPANPKDMPFAVVYFITLCAIYFLADSSSGVTTNTTHNTATKTNINNYLKILILGILFGFTQSLRIVGFTVYIIYILYRLYSALVEQLPLKTTTSGVTWLRNITQLLTIFQYKQNKQINLKSLYIKIPNLRTLLNYIADEVLKLILIFTVAGIIMAATWPYIGGNFIKSLIIIMESSQEFPEWDKDIFYMGKFYPVDERPWHYLPVWLAITTPDYIFILFALSSIIITKWFKHKLYMLFITSFWINILLYLILHPVIYNGLRHFLYLVPIIAFIAAITAIEALNTTNGASIIKELIKPTQKLTKSLTPQILISIVILMISVLGPITTAITMYKLHPYEYVYFNELVGGLKGAAKNFETEYWGASYKEAAEWVNTNVKTIASTSTVENNINNKGQPTKINVNGCVNTSAVQYYLRANNYYNTTSEDPDILICDSKRISNVPSEWIPIYEVKREGVVFATVSRKPSK